MLDLDFSEFVERDWWSWTLTVKWVWVVEWSTELEIKTKLMMKIMLEKVTERRYLKYGLTKITFRHSIKFKLFQESKKIADNSFSNIFFKKIHHE